MVGTQYSVSILHYVNGTDIRHRTSRWAEHQNKMPLAMVISRVNVRKSGLSDDTLLQVFDTHI